MQVGDLKQDPTLWEVLRGCINISKWSAKVAVSTIITVWSFVRIRPDLFNLVTALKNKVMQLNFTGYLLIHFVLFNIIDTVLFIYIRWDNLGITS